MIIMINGAFGSGKTSAAQMLQPLIPDSMIFDPEVIGYLLRNIIPEDVYFREEQTDDFQDLELWRILTVKTIQALMSKYKKHLIVPMTIYKTENFEYIMNELRNMDQDIFHFCLLASEYTIKNRIEKRGDTFGTWYEKHTKAGISAFKDITFQEHIETDNLETEEIVRMILRKIS